ncbi:MAG: hypothetical protein K6T73_02195 [Candidatus Bathyarchaeota archaeon]|nr:hypothetical protein [Candidatus Bathyarchaeota archaeon]
MSSDRNYLEIVLTNLDGSNPTIITRVNSTIFETNLDVAKDGAFIVYTERDRFYNASLYRERCVSRIQKFDFSTGETTLILEINGVITSLKVFPTNDKIAFTSYEEAYGIYNATLCTVNLDGSSLTKLLDFPEADTIFFGVSWTPNGTMLVFSEAKVKSSKPWRLEASPLANPVPEKPAHDRDYD